MRPSASVFAVAMTFASRCVSRRTRTPAAGLPRVVSSTWVESDPFAISEMEILFPYGSTQFASKIGQLAGNHFATVIEGNERLAELGRLVLWEGAQDFSIELA